MDILLAYSGGLDTSVGIRWLQDSFGADISALTVDVGQGDDLEAIRRKALACGAKDAWVVPARSEFADVYIRPAIWGNALYEGAYPLSTALARPLIAAKLAEVARKRGFSHVAHCCTGKGNDQVRFELALAAQAPDLRVVAPARTWGMTREEEIAYANAHGIPVSATVSAPYSIDENLWGRSIEGGALEDPGVEPPEEAFAWTAPVARSPRSPAYATIAFDHGAPLGLDGEELSLSGIISALNDAAGRHGVGRIDHIESRVVGIKSREVYECPAATVLLAAHKALEKLCLPRDVLKVKRGLEEEFSQLVYDGQWFGPLREGIVAFFAATQARVSGTVKVKLQKGQATVASLESEWSLYDPALATYGSGDAFESEAAEGFLKVLTLEARTWAKNRPHDTATEGVRLATPG